MPIAIFLKNSPRHEARPPTNQRRQPALRMRHRMYSCTHFLHVILLHTAAYRMRAWAGFPRSLTGSGEATLFFLDRFFAPGARLWLPICDVRSNGLRRSSRLAPKDMGFGFTDRAIWENLADD